jgi:hypothetical protein
MSMRRCAIVQPMELLERLLASRPPIVDRYA